MSCARGAVQQHRTACLPDPMGWLRAWLTMIRLVLELWGFVFITSRRWHSAFGCSSYRLPLVVLTRGFYTLFAQLVRSHLPGSFYFRDGSRHDLRALLVCSVLQYFMVLCNVVALLAMIFAHCWYAVFVAVLMALVFWYFRGVFSSWSSHTAGMQC